ncbi:hypothetical protein F5876DRAFT_67335 [Lentinula aff. lateritia]|uniref:Uncharacterized protein n=1 Tax=Lentinula aff. lateritia TaxID=2804960 RepID=A0ACC1TUQ1_9AGAR|nr:hypothetical protein F5876DRAFT_67335 [Lentinula aff. lateritia]
MRLIVTTYIALLGLFAAVAVHAAPFQASDNNLLNVRRSGEIVTLLESRAGQSPGAQTQAQQAPADHSELGKTKGASSKRVQWDPDVKEPTGSNYKNAKIIVTFTGEAAELNSEGKPLTSSSANAAKAVHEPQATNVPIRIRARLNEWAENNMMFGRKRHIVYNGKYMLGDTDAGFSFTYRFSGDVKKTEYPISLPPVSHSGPAAEDSDSSFDPRMRFSSDSD